MPDQNPPNDHVRLDAPLRLSIAAKLAFADPGHVVSQLQRLNV
jgi:hypothetical protein